MLGCFIRFPRPPPYNFQDLPAVSVNIDCLLNIKGDTLHTQNIAMTFYGNIRYAPVGLPTCASNSLLFCLLRLSPNDWLSPTNRCLGTYGISQCGGIAPLSLVKHAHLAETGLCGYAASETSYSVLYLLKYITVETTKILH